MEYKFTTECDRALQSGGGASRFHHFGAETIRIKLNYLGYRLKRVAKVLPQKKFQKLMQSSSN